MALLRRRIYPRLRRCARSSSSTYCQYASVALPSRALHPRASAPSRDEPSGSDRVWPGATSEAITTEAARRTAEIAVALRERGLDPLQVARFLDRVVFSLFAEDIGLLPEGLFTRVLETSRRDPPLFRRFAAELFTAMAEGGYVGLEEIRQHSTRGHLFEGTTVLELTAEEIEGLYRIALLDWSVIDPSILGSLFERGLAPGKRSQLDAHYTSREDIETLVEPVPSESYDFVVLKMGLEHLVPRWAGGEDSGDNALWVCRSCNSSKAAGTS